MKLDLYIQDLLFHHDCVVIPGLGGFIANYQAARFNPSLQIFYPPTKKVAFNSELKENDGLLAQYISKTQGCSYDEAMQSITDYVNDALQTLKTDKVLEIDRVGILRYNKDKNIEFKPGKESNFLLSSFGLSPVQAPAIRRTAPHKPISQKEEAIVLSGPKTSKIIAIKQPWRLLEVLPVAALLFYIILIPGSTNNINSALSQIIPDININLSDYFNSQDQVITETETNVESDYASTGVYVDDESNSGLILPKDVIEETNSESSKSIDVSELTKDLNEPLPAKANSADGVSKTVTTENKTEEVISEPIPEPIVEKEEPKPISIKSAPVSAGITATEKFHIIGGAFGVKSNADRFLNELKTYGYKAQIIGVNKKGLHMVSVHSTNSRNEMLAELSRIKKVLSDNVWVFSN